MASEVHTAFRASARALVLAGLTLLGLLLLATLAAGHAFAHERPDARGASVTCRTVSGGVRLCSHGPDAPPGGVDPRASTTLRELQRRASTGSYAAGAVGAATARTANAVSCIDDGKSGARVQGIYARLSGTPDRYSKVLPLLRKYASLADAYVSASAGQTRGGRHIRYVTTSCKLDIKRVTLSSASRSDFWRTIDELRAKGFKSDSRKYLIWMDVGSNSGICGVGTNIGDDRASQLNTNNQISGYARVDRQCWGGGVEMHELWHTLGAVQRSAPYSTANGHCRDEYDAMCYPDGYGVKMTLRCPGAGPWQLDCNHDNYFHTNPKAGSYLATHWNTAKSRWLQPGTPPPTQPVITLPALGKRVAGRPIPLAATSKVAGGRWITSWKWTDDHPYCSWTAATTSKPSLWCYADALGKVNVTATVTDNKGDSSASVKSFSLYDPGLWTPTMTLKVTPDTISAAGTTVTIDAVVKDSAGNPVYGLPVSFESSSDYALQPADLGGGRTNRQGLLRRTQVVNAHTAYTVYSHGNETWKARTATGTARWPVSMSASLAPDTVALPDPATISGTVTPLEPDPWNRGLELQRKSAAGQWEYVDYMTPAAGGAFSFTVAEQPVGPSVFRVVKTEAGRYSPTASAPLTLTTNLVVHPQTVTVTSPSSPHTVGCWDPAYPYSCLNLTGTLSYWGSAWDQPALELWYQAGNTWTPYDDRFGGVYQDYDYETNQKLSTFGGWVASPTGQYGTFTLQVRAPSWAPYAGAGSSSELTVTFAPPS